MSGCSPPYSYYGLLNQNFTLKKNRKKTWKGWPKLVGNMCSNCYVNYTEICIANRSVIVSATLNLNHIDIQEIKRRILCGMEWFYINVLNIETGIDAVWGHRPVAINTWNVSLVLCQNPKDNTWLQGNKFLLSNLIARHAFYFIWRNCDN